MVKSLYKVERGECYMDRLMDFLIKKAPYVLVIILGFIAPGNVFLFIWNRSLYMEMDVIKLLILSFGITYIAFIPNSVLGILVYFIHKKREKENQFTTKFQFIFYTSFTMILTVIELLTYIFFKLCGSKQTLSSFVIEFGIGIGIAIIILLLYKFSQSMLYKNKKSNQPSND